MDDGINVRCLSCDQPFAATLTQGQATVSCPFCKTEQIWEWVVVCHPDPSTRPAGAGIACILCGSILSSTIEQPRNGDRHEALVCGAHPDEELEARGLGALWAGGDTGPGTIHDDPSVRLTGAWELGADGGHAVYLLLDDGGLLIVTPEHYGVAVARVPRDRRLLGHPLGLEKHSVHPWELAVAEGANISSIRRREDGSVDLVLAGRGTVTFSTYYASWRELGDGKNFLAEDWSAGC